MIWSVLCNWAHRSDRIEVIAVDEAQASVRAIEALRKNGIRDTVVIESAMSLEPLMPKQCADLTRKASMAAMAAAAARSCGCRRCAAPLSYRSELAACPRGLS